MCVLSSLNQVSRLNVVLMLYISIFIATHTRGDLTETVFDVYIYVSAYLMFIEDVLCLLTNSREHNDAQNA